MSTLKVTNLQHPSAASANVTLDSSGNAAFSGGISGVTSVNGGQLGGSNIIQNGAFQIWQRGTSFTPPTSGTFTADRWQQHQGGGGVLYYEQSTDAPTGFSNSLKVTVNTADTSIAAGDFYYMRESIEGFNCVPLALGTSNAVTFTLSFYVKSSLTGTFNGCYQNNATNRSYVFEYTINAANVWERKTVTIVGDTTGTWTTDNTSGLRVIFDFGMGSNFNTTANSWQAGSYFCTSSGVKLVGTASATWYITGVQLEVGDTATSYQHESYGTTLQKCLRYYWRTTKSASNQVITTAIAYSSTVAVAPILFPVPMRSSPSFSISATSDFVYVGNNSSADPSQFQTDVVSVWSAQAYMVGSFTQGHAYLYRFDGDSPSNQYFAFDAEL